ncbi:hypothetical protein MKX07_000260 [Trichoderma sp. CBMAI-0711]|nr:hypothetical protein MKX07_000260 [Trichoderma sp. CBMAI-0711]
MSSLPEGVTVRDYLEARFPALAEATATESIFSSSGSPEPQLPAYDDDRPPPKYRPMEELAVEDEEDEEEQERATLAQQKRVLIFRLLAVFFCILVVSLAVAAGVVHSHHVKEKEMQQQQQLEGNETSSELRGPGVDEGLVVSLTVAVFAVGPTETATTTTTAVPFTT